MSTATAHPWRPVTAIGVSTPVTVQLTNPHGVRRVDAYIEQNGARYPILDAEYARHAASSGTGTSRPSAVTFEAGKNKAPNLKEGQARLVVEAVSNDLRGSTDTATADVNVVLDAAARGRRRASSTTSTRAAWNW